MLLCDNLLWFCSLAAEGVQASPGSCPCSEAHAVCWGEFAAQSSAALTALDGVAFAFLPSPHPRAAAQGSSQAGNSFLFRTSQKWNNSLHPLLCTHDRCWFLWSPGVTGLLQTAAGGIKCCCGGSSLLQPGIWAVTEYMSKTLFHCSSGFKDFVQISL